MGFIWPIILFFIFLIPFISFVITPFLYYVIWSSLLVFLLAVFIFVYISTLNDNLIDSPENISFNSNADVILNPGEALTIFDSTVSDDDMYMLTASLTTEYEDEIAFIGIDESSQDMLISVDQIINDFISESIFDTKKSDNNLIFWQTDNGLSQDDFDLISEDDFQNILEAIENANFNS